MIRRERVLVPYPPEVIAAIDHLVSKGEGNRTAFLVDLAKKEIKRQRLLEIFDHPDPIWKAEDHPEIDDGGNWVREMRAESEGRLLRIQDQPERN
jgi:hypothetical protein